MPTRPNASYAISKYDKAIFLSANSDSGTDFPSQVNRKIVMGRNSREVRTPSTGADRGVPAGSVIQGHWSKPRVNKISQFYCNPILKVRAGIEATALWLKRLARARGP